MRVAVFSTKPYDRRSLAKANERHGHELAFVDSPYAVAEHAVALTRSWCVPC